jgi:hypothetical protein
MKASYLWELSSTGISEERIEWGVGSIDPEEEQYFCTFLLGIARVGAVSTFLITHIHQQMHTIYIKSIFGISYMFQESITVLGRH